MTSQNVYQQVVREIYEAIGDVDVVTTCKAQYKAELEGNTSTHEVDVYWEFTDGDVTYKVIIQPQEQATLPELFNFARMLRDIPGLVLGVVITQPVYHKDIKDMAVNAGILLYEVLPNAIAETWENHVSDVQINVDKAWVKEAKEQAGLGDEPIQMSSEPKYSYIYDERRNCLDTVQGVFEQYTGQQAEGSGKQTIVHSFAVPAFLQTNHELVPFIKVNDITFDIESVKVKNLMGIEMLENILGVTLRYFGK